MRILFFLLVLAAPLHAGKLKVTFDCKKLSKSGDPLDIGSNGARIDGERIQCVAESKNHALLEGSAYIKPLWHKGSVLQPTRERHGEPIGEGPPFQYIFSLERGIDWDACAGDISFPLTVTDDHGQVVFEAKKSYVQTCGDKAAAPSRFDGGVLEQIPSDARALAKDFVDAVVDSDPPALAVFAGEGVKKGKKILKGNDAFSGNGLGPLHACDENNANCQWGLWAVEVKGPNQFCLYTENDSGYGKFPCATFTKKGGTWKWTAMTFYDTGEP